MSNMSENLKSIKADLFKLRMMGFRKHDKIGTIIYLFFSLSEGYVSKQIQVRFDTSGCSSTERDIDISIDTFTNYVVPDLLERGFSRL